MTRLFSFRSIWTKVFGLTTLLVTVMLVAASVSFVISYYKVNDVQLRVSHLAHVIIPLNQIAANIDSYSLQEEIRLEQALRRWSSETGFDDSYQTIIEEFLRFEESVETELESARSIIDDTLSNPEWLSANDAIQFGRIDTLLENIEKEHSEYFAHAKDVIENFESTVLSDADERINQLEIEASHLDDELFSFLSSLDELNITQATEIEAAETMVIEIYRQNFILTFAVFIIGIAASASVTTRLVKPVRDLKVKSEEITRGNLDIEVVPETFDEVGQLALTFNEMTKKLRANSQVKELFGKYVDPRIVDSLLKASPEGPVLGGHKQEMTIFFSDVKGFSAMSEMLTAAGLVRLINRYFSIMAEPIVAEKGVIDKYVGDCIMAFWGPPFTGDEEHSVLACLAALAQFEQLEKFNDAMPEILGFRKGVPELQIRIGLATGEVLSGNIGSENAKSYTVMGDPVNVASRLESLNKQYGTRILIDELTQTRIADKFLTREIDRVTLAGKNDITRIYELFSTADQAEPQLEAIFKYYESGLKAYRSSNWASAESSFSKCLEINSDDGPTLVMLERISQFKSRPPAKDWDGVWRFTAK